MGLIDKKELADQVRSAWEAYRQALKNAREAGLTVTPRGDIHSGYSEITGWIITETKAY